MQNFYHWGEHQFDIYRYSETKWSDIPGIYVFALSNGPFPWTPLYIGKAASFKDRLSNHERWNEAAQRGAVHVHAKVVHGEANRDIIERQLIQQYQPPMNTMLKSEGTLSGLLGVLAPRAVPNTSPEPVYSRGLLGGLLTTPSQPPQPPYLTGLLGMLDTAMAQPVVGAPGLGILDRVLTEKRSK
jgi:uncharacterized protein YggU (UPF0235/DUF167 family)